MKVCFLNHDLSETTGAGRFCLALTSALKKLVPDFDYRVLTHDDNALPKNKLVLLFSLLKIRRIFKDYDIIHALDGWPYGVMATLASLGLGKKLVITAIGTGAIQPLYNFWKQPLLKWTYRRANTITAVSRNTKREILKVIPDLQIEVINHGVDYKSFQLPRLRRGFGGQAISNYQLPVSKPYILSVGALKKRKGYEFSIKAFAEIAPRFPALKYVIVGDGTERKNLELTTNNLQLGDRVIFLNNLSEEELIALYKNAELFILLPQDVGKDIEGFGLVFLEAAACGLPVIATKESSAEDAVLDDKNGVLVPPKDFAKAAQVMKNILQDINLRTSMLKHALGFARSMSWGRAANRYAEIYRAIF